MFACEHDIKYYCIYLCYINILCQGDGGIDIMSIPPSP